MILRAAYFLIAACIVLAIPASLDVPPAWFLLIGLFGGRLYLLSLDPFLVEDRISLISSVAIWTVVHVSIGLTDARFQALVGLPLLSLPLMYWLMTRFSNITEQWTTSSFRVTTVLIAVAGWGLYSRGSGLFVALTPICILIVAAHVYHAFANHTGSRTLAAHWVGLALVLWIGIGLFGETPLGEQVNLPDMQGTNMQLMVYASLAVILGMGNQITADWRREHRRITGLSAYWLVTFGVIMNALINFGLGLVSIFLNRITTDWFQVRDLWESFFCMAALWQFAIPLGLIIYAIQFFIRRPPGLLSLSSEPRRPRSPSPHN